MPELTQAADGLHPAKDLFHEFPFPLTHVVARVPRRPAIDRAPAHLLRHVGRDGSGTHGGNEAHHIVALVRPDRATRRRTGLQQQRGVGALIQRGGRAVAGMLTIATAGGS